MRTEELALHNLTLIRSRHFCQAVSPAKDTVLAAGDASLTLYSVSPDSARLHQVDTSPLFACCRQMRPLVMAGDSRKETYIVASSDSGKLSLLRAVDGKIEMVGEETFGKSGCRRVVPGQFLATDPKGRAVMVAALEKQKIVYVITRDPDAGAAPVISSPLENTRPNTLTFDCKGVEVGYENPVFACIELDFTASDKDHTSKAFESVTKVFPETWYRNGQELVHYELDLGLNHIVRKWAHPIDYTANMLIPLPGGRDGPSGVLVCSENYITWMHPDFSPHRLPIPHRPNTSRGGKNIGVLVSSYAVHKMKKTFFVLVQTELGDIFKVTAEFVPANPDGSGGRGVTNLKLKYFDTIPVAASLILLKSGFLFAASEFGNQYVIFMPALTPSRLSSFLYQLENLGDDDETQQEFHSIDFSEELIAKPVYFNPRGLANISAVDEIESLSPILDSKVLNMTPGTDLPSIDTAPQIYAVCGRAARSSFRVLRHGLATNEFAVSELPGTPNGVWTLRKRASDSTDGYIIVSFANATLVLAVSEAGVEECTDTGFLADTPTLCTSLAGADSYVQIYPRGIRHIRPGKRPSEWKTPSGQEIIHTAANERQVVVGLSNGQIVYFELDSSGNLNEYQERKEMTAAVTCLCLGPVPPGRVRSKFLAIGCQDNTVRILSLEPDTCLEPIGMQTVPEMPLSVAITLMKDVDGDGSDSGMQFLHIGLSNGVLLRGNIDMVTGTLSDSRLRFIGTRQVGLYKVDVGGRRGNGLLILSSRPWLAYTHQGTPKLVPITYEALDYGTGFTSEQCPQGIVAVSGNTLRIIALEKLGEVFNQGAVPLQYTPRRIVPAGNNFITIESDHGILCDSEQTHKKADEEEELPVEQFGLPRALPNESGKWASCIRMINPFEGDTLFKNDLDLNEAAFCVSVVKFRSDPSSTYVVVGTARDVVLSPRSCSSGFLRTYKLFENNLELHHVTPIEDIPTAICSFQGRMLVGLGNALRIYELGKKKMLRKCEFREIPNRIIDIQTIKDRIIISDVQEGVFFCRFLSAENKFVCFADPSIPRFMTAFTILDYDTIIGGDKFGNVFVLRVPLKLSEEAEDDPAAAAAKPSHKLMNLCEFHIGESITSIHKTSLVPGGRELILYTTVLGTIGVLIPFLKKDDYSFFQMLEMHMRQEYASLLGRDHLAYRSTHMPVRCIVDGDLVEQYSTLPAAKQREIAEGMEKTTTEIHKKIEDARVKVAF